MTFAENSKNGKHWKTLVLSNSGEGATWCRVQGKTFLGAGLSGTPQLPDERALDVGSVVLQLSVSLVALCGGLPKITQRSCFSLGIGG